MPSKDYFSAEQNSVDFSGIFQIIIIFVKILIIGCLLYLGMTLTFWAMEIVELFIKAPNELPLFDTILAHDSATNLLKITKEGSTIIIEDGDLLKWMMIFFIVMTIFNVIGRAITGIFKSMVTLLTHIDLSSLKKDKMSASEDTQPKHPKEYLR